MAPYNSISLSQIITAVRADLGPAAFWTDTEIRNFINAALRTWNCLTGFWSGTKTLTTVGNRPYYPLGTALVFGARVELNGVPLDPGSVFEWDQQDPHWMSSRGAPQMWAPVGIAIIALNPVPPAGGDSLVVYGTSVTPVLVAPGDKVNIGREDFNTLTDYIAHTLQFKSGGAEFKASKTAFQAFIKAAGLRNEKLRASNFYRKILGLDQDRVLKRIRAQVQAITQENSNPIGMR